MAENYKEQLNPDQQKKSPRQLKEDQLWDDRMKKIRREIMAGSLFQIKENGSVMINKRMYQLGEKFNTSILVKIDDNHFGVAQREKLGWSQGDKNFVVDFEQLLTLKPDGGYEITPFSMEEALPRHEDESEHDYKLRTMLHEGGSQARSNLVRSRLEHGSGIDLSKLSQREKISLTNYYFSTSDRGRTNDALIEFTKEYGAKGLKIFLACEYGMDVGDQIILLGEKLPKDLAEKIFKKYREIIRLAANTVEAVKANFDLHNIGDQEKNKIKQNILKKARDLLFDFEIATGRGAAPDANEIESKLDRIKNDIILFAATFKEVAKSQKVSAEELKAVSVETKTADQLSPGECEAMGWIFEANWKNEVPDPLYDHLMAGFENALEGNSEFHLYKYNNEIVSFLRFQDLGNHRVYAGSFNMRPEAKGARLGASMAKAAFDEKAKDNVIEATVYSGKEDLLNYYREKFKLTLTDDPIIDDYEGTGEKFFRVERDDRARQENSLAA